MEWPCLQYTFKGMKRLQSTSSKRSRLPIMSDVMQVASPHSSKTGPAVSKPKTFWAACFVRFFGFLCAGEFTLTRAVDSYPIQAADLSVDSHLAPTVIRILLRKSKTDVVGQGEYFYFGKTEQVVCPISPLLRCPYAHLFMVNYSLGSNVSP